MIAGILRARRRQFAALLFLIGAGSAFAGTAVYTGSPDAVQLSIKDLSSVELVSYVDDAIQITSGFVGRGTLPTNDGLMTGVAAGDFRYDLKVDTSAIDVPAAGTTFLGPTITLDGVTYASIYTFDSGLSLPRVQAVYSIRGTTTLIGATTQMPSSPPGFLFLERQGNNLFLGWRPAAPHPAHINFFVTVNLTAAPSGGDLSASAASFGIFASNIHATLTEVAISGTAIPDVDQQGGGEGEGEGDSEGEVEGEAEGEADPGPQGPGIAAYTGDRDSIQLEEPGVFYEGNRIHFEGATMMSLPRAGGTLSNIAPGHWTYTVDIADLPEEPAFPQYFFGISVALGNAEYNLRFADAVPGPGVALEVKATRGLAGGLTVGQQSAPVPPSSLTMERAGDQLSFRYTDAAKTDYLIGSVDLTDPLGDQSVDDSGASASFLIYPMIEAEVTHIEVRGNPMYTVNPYSGDPEAELPLGLGTVLGVTLGLGLLGGRKLRGRQ